MIAAMVMMVMTYMASVLTTLMLTMVTINDDMGDYDEINGEIYLLKQDLPALRFLSASPKASPASTSPLPGVKNI